MPFYEEISWEKAACQGIEVDMFYWPEERGKNDQVVYLDPLRAICASCPIWAECLAYATVHEFFGVWGGMTTVERKSLLDNTKLPIRLQVLQDLQSVGISQRMIYEALEVIDGLGEN